MVTSGVSMRRALVVLFVVLLIVSGCGGKEHGDSVPLPNEEDYADDSSDVFQINTTQNFNYLVVDLPNTSPVTDPVGYTCTGKVTIPRDGFGGYDLLHIKVIRETPMDNHVAFMQNSIENLTVMDYISNGHYIFGWNWLRDKRLAHYTGWTLTDLPPGDGDINLDMTVLATDRMDGDRGFDAHFLLYYQFGQQSAFQREDELDNDDLTADGVFLETAGERARISAGNSHCLDLRVDGSIWAWGNNIYYRLGDGTGTHRKTPVQVRGPSGVGFLTLFDPPDE